MLIEDLQCGITPQLYKKLKLNSDLSDSMVITSPQYNDFSVINVVIFFIVTWKFSNNKAEEKDKGKKSLTTIILFPPTVLFS